MTALDILHRVSKTRGIAVSRLRGPERQASIVRARHECMWLLRTQLPLSLPEIGRLFGRHHTTVMDGIRWIAFRVDADDDYREELENMVRPVTFGRACWEAA